MPGGGGADGARNSRRTSPQILWTNPMREGLVRSRNLVSIRLLRGTGLVPAMRHIQNFGFGPSALPPNLTLALGTGQTTPLDMARGFAVFANGGFKVTPYFIVSVHDAKGAEVFQAAPLLACPECALLADEAARASAAGMSPMEPGGAAVAATDNTITPLPIRAPARTACDPTTFREGGATPQRAPRLSASPMLAATD
jgi:penicillin-binding protein 1A